jgi:carbamoyl-phosphate synthase large subunit
MRYDVLVTGAGALLGQGILKALRASDHVARVIACDAAPAAVGLYLADAARLLPRCDAPGYADAVIEVARRERVALILCGTDLELPALAANRARIEAETGAHVVVSDAEAIAIAEDKWLTVQFLRAHGFDAPRSALAADAHRLADEVGYPLVVKPRIGAGSVGLTVARDRVQLERALEVHGMVVQEYLRPDEEEYTVGTIVHAGACAAAVALKRTLRHGNTHTAISNGYDAVEAYAARVAAALPGARGPINVQLRRTGRGPVVFEFNARFSGTTPLRHELGWNEVEAVLLHALERRPVPRGRLRRGAVLRWTAEVLVPLEQIEQMQSGRLDAPAGLVRGVPERR